MKSTRLASFVALSAVATIAIAACTKAAESSEGDSKAVAETLKAAKSGINETPAAQTGAVMRPAVEPSEAAKPVETADNAAKADVKAPKVAIGETKTKIIAMGEKTVAETDAYLVKIKTPDDGAKKGAVTLNVVPKKGWKLNQEFPTKLTVKPPPGVKVAKEKLGSTDAVKFGEKGAEFAVNFDSSSSGAKEFKAKFKFAVCTETTCDPKKEQLAWVVNIK